MLVILLFIVLLDVDIGAEMPPEVDWIIGVPLIIALIDDLAISLDWTALPYLLFHNNTLIPLSLK